uniref:Uncharacterized protein n=1 Tax=Anguilla anguilla TaxID=7936 RepID=A0A0E9QYS3_ANGAN
MNSETFLFVRRLCHLHTYVRDLRLVGVMNS